MAEQLTLPIPVYLTRWATDEFTPGDSVDWKVGDPAWYLERDGEMSRVVVDSVRLGHHEAPGVPCYEGRFLKEGVRRCMIAHRLRVRDGWKP